MKSVTTLLHSISVVCLGNTPHGCIFEFLVRNYSSEKRFENRSADFTALVYMRNPRGQRFHLFLFGICAGSSSFGV